MSPRSRGRRIAVAVAITVTAAGTIAFAQGSDVMAEGSLREVVSSAPSQPAPAGGGPPQAHPGSAISIGSGFLSFPDAASQWVQDNPDDPRAAAIANNIADQPSALWLTGNESFDNLDQAVSEARASDRTMILTLYNIPLRYDGLSAPTTLSLTAYKTWVNRVASTIANTRAVVAVEPDALWFYDRMPSNKSRATRMTALNYVVDTMAKKAPRARLYLDAGTSSGSVTPQRMAALLAQAGVSRAAGFAVNISSYAPTTSIQAYAQAIRAALQSRGIANPRYVTDTGRNGASSWDYNWCNPPEQRLGSSPRVVDKSDGRDMDLWIKAPGTSDGDCGPEGGGAGTYGGEFIPGLAYSMLGR